MTELPTDLIMQRCTDRKWQYPEPIEDLNAWVATNSDFFDPQHVHRLYWPDRPYQPGMDILIVDGGTTQAPVIARTNPDARVTATVLSETSLAHAIYLRHKFGLLNLDLHLLPTTGISGLNRTFDLVIASGALQHAGFTEAQEGMKALAQVVRPEGVAAFLVYSRYLQGARNGAPQIDSPLHAGGVNFTAQDCVDLVAGAGLVFQDWLLKSPYYLPQLHPDDGALGAIARLPEPQMWSVLEPLRNQTGCHLFTACSTERSAEAYRIDFSDPRALDYVPGWRQRTGLDGRHAVRPGWSMLLDATRQEMAERIDGFSTIAQIAGNPELEPVAIDLFADLWRMDFIMIGTGGVAGRGDGDGEA